MAEHVEIPGYYYDSVKNRYFKKQPYQFRANSTKAGIPTEASNRKKPRRVHATFHGSLYHYLRHRTTSLLECNTVTDRTLEELLVPLYSEDHDTSLQLSQVLREVINASIGPEDIYTIKDMKIDESGRYLALAVCYECSSRIMPSCRRQDIILHLHTHWSGRLGVDVVYNSKCFKSMASSNQHFSDFYHIVDKEFDGHSCSIGIYRYVHVSRFETRFVPLVISNNEIKVTVHHNNVRIIKGHISSISCDHHGNLVYANKKGEINYLNEDRRPMKLMKPVTAIAKMNESPLCICFDGGGLVAVDHSTRRTFRRNDLRSTSVGIYRLNRDNKHVIISSQQKLELWDTISYRSVLSFRPSTHSTIQIDSNDMFLLQSTDNDYINIWSITTGRLITTLPVHASLFNHTHSLGGCHGYPATIAISQHDSHVTVYKINVSSVLISCSH